MDLTEDQNAASEIDPPDLHNWLLSFLETRRMDYEGQFATDGAAEEHDLLIALDRLESHAIELVTTGKAPAELEALLKEYQPGDAMPAKVRELLRYKLVHHRLEFDIAVDVISRLRDADKRIVLVSVFTILLIGYRPSPTALKYFQRATTLFLAGYETESVVMCGAVLEAALRARFSDALLANAGIRPAVRRTNDYTIAQRLKFERSHPVFSEQQRINVSKLLDARNDAVHVQPDIVPKAAGIVASLALLLVELFPAE